jgi:hypothetical protein
MLLTKGGIQILGGPRTDGSGSATLLLIFLIRIKISSPSGSVDFGQNSDFALSKKLKGTVPRDF